MFPRCFQGVSTEKMDGCFSALQERPRNSVHFPVVSRGIYCFCALHKVFIEAFPWVFAHPTPRVLFPRHFQGRAWRFRGGSHFRAISKWKYLEMPFSVFGTPWFPGFWCFHGVCHFHVISEIKEYPDVGVPVYTIIKYKQFALHSMYATEPL